MKELRFFLKYVFARIKCNDEEVAYKIYVTDLLKGIIESTGGKVERRYYDCIKPQVVETRTSDEIIVMMKAKLGGLET